MRGGRVMQHLETYREGRTPCCLGSEGFPLGGGMRGKAHAITAPSRKDSGMFFKVLSISILLIAAPIAAKAGHPLWNDSRVHKELFDIAVADQVRKNCSSISGRIILGMRQVRDLYAHAQSLGYSRKQVEDFVNNKAEQNELRIRVLAYFAKNSASVSTPNGLCALGKREINNNTGIGRLLRG